MERRPDLKTLGATCPNAATETEECYCRAIALCVFVYDTFAYSAKSSHAELPTLRSPRRLRGLRKSVVHHNKWRVDLSCPFPLT
eukprot:4537618-Pyramimonas_sp.AAC.1